jgi:hypothetical protein
MHRKIKAPNCAPRNMPGTDNFGPGAIALIDGAWMRKNGDWQYANPVTWYQGDEDTVDRSNGYQKQSLLLRLGSRVTQLQTC